jgi:hypothetical protein
MRLLGIVFALGGWAIAVSGLFLTTDNTIRIFIALAGIAVSVFGILGVINRYYLARAIWKK